MPAWDPDVVVDAPLARHLVASQFPELRDAPVRFLAAGWDNAVYLVAERWAFRFPQREIAIPGIEREIAVLPTLAPMLPAPIPEPTHIGQPADGYPWPFFGTRFVVGQELAAAGLDEAGRRRLAGELGRFLRALHDPAVAERIGDRLPVDPMRRADMPHRIGVTREWLAGAAAAGTWDETDAERAEALFRLALELGDPDPRARRVAHGDLHLRHAVVRPDGSLAGVIDWGDLCLGDPAIDLSLGWSFLEGEARAEFLAAYGPVDRAAELRARVLGLMLSGALAAYGRDVGLAWLEREAAAGLRRSLAGDAT